MKYFFSSFLSIYLLTLVPCVSQAEWINSAFPLQLQGGGLKADYYNGANFEEKVFSRIDEEINFYYLKESPAPAVNREYYSIRWTGSLYAPVTGTYKVNVVVDDGIRMWVDGVKVLDQWKLQRENSYTGQLHLKAGEFYKLKIEYFNDPAHGIMQLKWEMPEEEISSFFGLFASTYKHSRETIPKQYLYKNHMKKMLGEKLGILNKESVHPTADRAEQQSTPEKELVSRNISSKQPAQNKETEYQGIQKRESQEDLLNMEAEQMELEEDTFDNLKPGEEVPLNNLLFEQGKYILVEGSSSDLDKLVRTFNRYPHLKIRIEGHTDNVGNPKLNQSLSCFRAKVVATYLLEHDIDPSRIDVKGFGSSRPVADNSTEKGRAKNRRVQFVVK